MDDGKKVGHGSARLCLPAFLFTEATALACDLIRRLILQHFFAYVFRMISCFPEADLGLGSWSDVCVCVCVETVSRSSDFPDLNCGPSLSSAPALLNSRPRTVSAENCLDPLDARETIEQNAHGREDKNVCLVTIVFRHGCSHYGVQEAVIVCAKASRM